ncbi:MAG: carboxypeptidase-like regulatory domain-containing protein [Vallitalea sp.]|jgi:5-hydroxyisourate hydrolase-like protein (transthyretin family)|nr:carboxypeptidase-like regulatory domain-containing protein [Vallitalea sp.]
MTSYDKYDISYSKEITSEGRQENHIDLTLNENTNTKVGIITGTVLVNGDVVANATVKLNTADMIPYAHINTNIEGQFTFTSIPSGSYLIAATKEGYTLSNPMSITVRQNKTTNVTLKIKEDPNANKNIIFGIVKSDNIPIEYAYVQLYKKEAKKDIYIGKSVTNDTGQYLFIDLDDGSYYIKVSKIGYYETSSQITDISDKEYVTLNIALTPDPAANTGVICGIIIDNATKQPIYNALVALYTIEGSVETLVRLTRTNVEGKYLFGNIISGKYRIKSTVQAYEK